MKMVTEAQLCDLLRQAYNAGFDSSGEGFNGEYLNSRYEGYGAEAIEKQHENVEPEDWVVVRNQEITQLIGKV